MEGETKFISNEIIEAKYKNSAKTRLESDKEKIENYLLKAKETTRRKRMLDEMSEKNKIIQKQLEKSLNAIPTIQNLKYFNEMKNDSIIINK
jgi:tRNA(Glu) U13 pseudouridine synthase TruD